MKSMITSALISEAELKLKSLGFKLFSSSVISCSLSGFVQRSEVATPAICITPAICLAETSYLLTSFVWCFAEAGWLSKHSRLTFEIVEDSFTVFKTNPSLCYFWKSCSPISQENIQLLVKMIALRDLSNIPAMLVNNEVIKTQVQERIGSITEVSILSSWQGKADCRLVSHIDWSVKRGCERVVVVFNDTDYVVLILGCITTFINMELEEVWVEFGREHRPKITRHSHHASFGAAFW